MNVNFSIPWHGGVKEEYMNAMNTYSYHYKETENIMDEPRHQLNENQSDIMNPGKKETKIILFFLYIPTPHSGSCQRFQILKQVAHIMDK